MLQNVLFSMLLCLETFFLYTYLLVWHVAGSFLYVFQSMFHDKMQLLCLDIC